jgi:peptidyl-prolyl cis-trans isomerase C
MSRPVRAVPLAVLALALAVALSDAVAQAPSTSRPSGDDVIARVDGRPILRRDYDLAVQLQFQGRRTGSVSLEELRAVRHRVLEGLIDGELLYVKAVKTKVTVSDTEVQEELERLRKSFDEPDHLGTLLKAHGLSEKDFKERLRRDLVVSHFVDQEVMKGAKVGDDEVRRYYDDHPEEMKRPEGVRVSQIVVLVAPDAKAPVRARAREKIEEILKELKMGKDFGEMARRYSEGPEAQRDGDSGYVTKDGRALPPIEKAAFALPTGRTSDIIETRRGFHILKVTARRKEGPIPFEEVTEPIRAKLTALRREARIQEYVTGLKASARIERLEVEKP